MVFKQGNTYQLKATIDADLTQIEKIIFQFNDVKKQYLSDGTGEVQLEGETFIVPLSQEDTIQMGACDSVNAEVAVKFQDGSVKRSRILENLILDTIIDKVV